MGGDIVKSLSCYNHHMLGSVMNQNSMPASFCLVMYSLCVLMKAALFVNVSSCATMKVFIIGGIW